MATLLRTKLARRETVASGVVDFHFDLLVPERLIFQPGQFVTLAVGTDVNDRPVRRSYSIASPADEGNRMRLIMRLVAGGPASDFFAPLAPGSEVEMTGPHGFFVLDPHHPGDVVFAATGTGVAPVLSMLAELAHRPEPGRRFVYWGLRQQSDLFALDEVRDRCQRANVALHLYLSQPSASWTGQRGRIIPPILEAQPGLEAPTFYIVGNGAMIQELKTGLVARGVNRKKQIRTEAFFD